MINLQIIGIGGSIGMGVFLILCGYAAGREWVRQFEAECRKRDALKTSPWPTRRYPKRGTYRGPMA